MASDDRGDLSGVRSSFQYAPDYDGTGDIQGVTKKQTLSAYLSDRTAGGAEYGDRQRPGGNKNRFQVPPPSIDQETISHQGANGSPADLKPASNTDPGEAGEAWESSQHTIGTYMDLVRDVQDQRRERPDSPTGPAT